MSYEFAERDLSRLQCDDMVQTKTQVFEFRYVLPKRRSVIYQIAKNESEQSFNAGDRADWEILRKLIAESSASALCTSDEVRDIRDSSIPP